eukprot:SAG31_NODE_16108_length_722_cov_1.309791_2_plen_22_part_01
MGSAVGCSVESDTQKKKGQLRW